MMNEAFFFPPGACITCIVGGLYLMNARAGRGVQPQAEGAVAMSLRVEGLKIYYRTLYGDVKAVDNVSFFLDTARSWLAGAESGCGNELTLGGSSASTAGCA